MNPQATVEPTWEEKITLIENAFRALPKGKHQPASAIPVEFLISGLGRQLLLMGYSVPPNKPAVVKESISDLARQAGRMADVLNGLPREAVQAINAKWTDVALLRLQLNALAASAQAAKVHLKPGALKKVQPRAIAEIVAVHYQTLTGNKPTVPKQDGKAYGPFLELLQTVFAILKVKASAQSQAEAISRSWNSAPQKVLGMGYGKN